MNRRISAREQMSLTVRSGDATGKTNRPASKSARSSAPSEHGWAHANRAWMVAYRLAASRR